MRTESVRDEFSSGSWSDNEGTVDWAGPWQENDTLAGGDGPTVGQVRIRRGELGGRGTDIRLSPFFVEEPLFR